jgi:hypothetical protein
VRWAVFHSRRIAPFGQLLAGVEHERSDIERFGADATSHWMVQPGAGVSARVTARDALFAEIDLRHIPGRSGDVNALRLLVGVRFDLR